MQGDAENETPKVISFGELRSALNSEPNLRYRAWRRLCQWVESQPEEVFEQHQAYIEQHLGLWDDSVRRVPSNWLDMIAKGENASWMTMCRTFSLSGRMAWKDSRIPNRFKRSVMWPHITRLELWREPISRDNFFALINSPTRSSYIAPLQEFMGVKLRLGVGFLSRMFESASFASLRSLTLHTTYLTMADLDDFCSAPLSARLESLDLSDNNLGSEGFDVLVQSAFLRPKHLVWADNATNLEQCALNRGFFERLESLVWGHWGDLERVQDLLDVLDLSPLKTLHLEGDGIAEVGTRLLSQSACRLGLQELGFASSLIGKGELDQLFEQALFPCLRRMDLRRCQVPLVVREKLEQRAQVQGLELLF